MDLIDRFRGCMLGLAVGDAVGTTVEFESRGSFPPVVDMVGFGPFGLKPGEWTDDTSMALCLASSLLERDGFDAQDQMERYWNWYQNGYMSSNGKCFDIGHTTRTALIRFKETGNPLSGPIDPYSAGNGSIMRLAPVVLFYYPNLNLIQEYSAKSSQTTHGAVECVEACLLLGSIIFNILQGMEKEKALLNLNSLAFTSPSIKEIAAGSYFNKSASEIKGTGYVVNSLEAALWSFWTTETFEEAILKAVNLGDDADTTAAICGQVAGAFYGEQGIPSRWLARLVMRKEIGLLAERLYKKQKESGQYSINSLPALISAIKEGLKPNYIFFWSHRSKSEDQIGKQCLSQWYPSSFIVEGISYPTAEHYMMAEKARLFGDDEIRKEILLASTPEQAKKLGKLVKGFDNETWLQHRFDIIIRGNEAKFSQNEAIKKFLIETNDKILVEASPSDCIWGIGLPESDPHATNPEQWKGINLLGFALMVVRSRIAEQKSQMDHDISEHIPTTRNGIYEGHKVIDNLKLFKDLLSEDKIYLQNAPFLTVPPKRLPEDFNFDRVEGMLLGLAVGDSLGNTTEAWLPDERRTIYGEVRNYLANPHAEMRAVGLPSDDTQMAFWTLEQLIEDGGLIPDHLASKFTKQQIYGIGTTVKKFLKAYKNDGISWMQAGQPSAGNGALMRIAPVLIPHLLQPSPAIWADTALAGMITHDDRASNSCCIAFTHILWECLRMKQIPEPMWWVDTFTSVASQLEGETSYMPRRNGNDYQGSVWQFVQREVSLAIRENWTVLDACNQWYSGAYLLETMPCVLYILSQYAGDPENAIVRAVNDTKDNDTVAAIVGAAIGALHGRSGLPERWVGGLLGRTGASDNGHIFKLIEDAKHIFWEEDLPLPVPDNQSA